MSVVEEAQETFDATVNRLKGYRNELTEAEQQLGAARKERNAAEVSRLTIHVQTLREFITDEEATARVAAEELNREEAAALIELLSEQYRNCISLIDGASEDARAIIREATEAVGAVYETFNKLQWMFRAIELLRLRFPDLEGARVAPPPPPPNVAVSVFSAEAKAIETVPRPVISVTAAMSSERKIEAGYNGLEEFVKDYGSRLPDVVREFFERAGATPRV